jgi:predicted alpha/beta-hydrolase family hydrolase
MIVAVAHGAGAGMDHPFLTGFADALHELGIATLRFNFPYLEAGRRMPGPAGHAVATWEAVAAEAARIFPGARFIAAGKSYGGRMASMAASEGRIAPEALVYLGYPLHPPGDPAKIRSAHLPSIEARQLFVEGTNDPFIQPLADFEAAVSACRRAEVLWIAGGGHSFEVKGVKAGPAQVGAALAAPVAQWLS